MEKARRVRQHLKAVKLLARRVGFRLKHTGVCPTLLPFLFYLFGKVFFVHRLRLKKILSVVVVRHPHNKNRRGKCRLKNYDYSKRLSRASGFAPVVGKASTMRINKKFLLDSYAAPRTPDLSCAPNGDVR